MLPCTTWLRSPEASAEQVAERLFQAADGRVALHDLAAQPRGFGKQGAVACFLRLEPCAQPYDDARGQQDGGAGEQGEHFAARPFAVEEVFLLLLQVERAGQFVAAVTGRQGRALGGQGACPLPGVAVARVVAERYVDDGVGGRLQVACGHGLAVEQGPVGQCGRVVEGRHIHGVEAFEGHFGMLLHEALRLVELAVGRGGAGAAGHEEGEEKIKQVAHCRLVFRQS